MEDLMDSSLPEAKEHFIHGLSRISQFWGFPKAMGAIFGAVYLSADPVSLDELVLQVGVTKGAVSTNIRHLERLGIVHKKIVLGDRKDYYVAETDFWKIVKGILHEREKNEFNLAIQSVGESLEILERQPAYDPDARTAAFCRERMLALKQFFDSLDNLVATLLAVDDLRNNAVKKLFKKKKK